jgi:hypothetical protein
MLNARMIYCIDGKLNDRSKPYKLLLSAPKRMNVVPDFEREVMFYLVFASVFPGTVPHIHGIIQVIIIIMIALPHIHTRS